MDDSSPTTMFGGDEDREMLHVVTQETRFLLVQNILGHPKQLPSAPELAYLNPGKSEGTLHDHLKRLADVGMIEVRTLSSDRRERDLPYKFYGISREGEVFLNQYDIFESDEKLHTIYERVEKSERTKRYESAPRPA